MTEFQFNYIVIKEYFELSYSNIWDFLSSPIYNKVCLQYLFINAHVNFKRIASMFKAFRHLSCYGRPRLSFLLTFLCGRTQNYFTVMMISYIAAHDEAENFREQVERRNLIAFASMKHHYPLTQQKLRHFTGRWI